MALSPTLPPHGQCRDGQRLSWASRVITVHCLSAQTAAFSTADSHLNFSGLFQKGGLQISKTFPVSANTRERVL